MRKIIAILLCFAALLTVSGGCAKGEPAAENVVFTGTIEGINGDSILVSTSDDVGFDKASVSFEPGVEIAFNFLVGQVVKLTILPQIAESYPVQVRAVAIELVSSPAENDPDSADFTARFFRADGKAEGGWEFVGSLAANAETMIISSVRHIPVISVESAAALSEFLEAGSEFYQFDIAYGGEESFVDAAKKYDDAFFADHLLLILCTQETSGSIRHEIAGAPIAEGKLTVIVKAVVPEIGTDDMADWFIVLEIAKDEIKTVDKFDAYYGA
ncbi:MAG: hypothetical protein AAGU74_05575 [Bacillota bacterium]